MENQGHIPQVYVMRDFGSSPAARALRTAVRLSIRVLCLGAALYLAVPSSGPTIPVRTIPDYARIQSLATTVSGPEDESGFTKFVSWVAPPRFNWDYLARLEEFEVFDLTAAELNPEVEQTVSELDTLTPDTSAPETVAVAFFVPDSSAAAEWDFTVPDRDFVVSAVPKAAAETPEPRSAILFALGMAALTPIGLFYCRKRNSGARHRG
jgi:hypothetical protein